MEPIFTAQETFAPNYFRDADLAMLDAIGWDYPPENTACDQALELTCGVRHFDNSLAGGAPDPPLGCGTGGNQDGAVWFYFVATSTSARLSTCDSAAQDSTIAVYEGPCGTLLEIACSEDDRCGSPGLSTVCLNELTIGQTYYVQLAARTSNDRGIYSLALECSCDAACADVCCSQAEPPATENGSLDRSRFISLVPGNPGRLTAIRVTLGSLYDPLPPNPGGPGADLSPFEGQTRWVGPPQTFTDNTIPPTQFRAALLQCDPYFADWSSEPIVFITGREIVPSSVYEAQTVDQRCMSAGVGEAGFSEALVLSTARWGDVTPPFQDPMAVNASQPNILDVAAVVDKVKVLPQAPPRVRVQLQPEIPAIGSTVNVIDVAMCVDAIRGKPYPFAGPQPCP
jgi:hypothetical protein